MALKNYSDLTVQRFYKKKRNSQTSIFQVLSFVLLFSSLFQFQLFYGVEATTTTGESSSEKEKGTTTNGESVQFQFFPSPSTATTTTSLFDSLPLNGAFVMGKDSIIPSLNRSPSLKRFKIKVRNPSHFNGSTSLSSSPTVLKNLNNIIKNPSTTTTTTRETTGKVDMEKEKSSSSSLFDLLPNQGAMISSSTTTTIETGSTSHDQGDKNPNPRNQRSPLKLLNKRFDASFRGGFEIEPQNPTSEFSLSFFNENVLPPIIKTLTQDDNPEITRLSPPVEIKSSGGYSSSSYQPPPPPPSSSFIQRQPYQNPQPLHQNTHYKVATAIRETSSNSYYNKKPNVGTAASSGGSTVIIYANPQSPSSNTPTQGPPPIRNSYGVPPPYFTPTQTTTTTTTATPIPKNEIHYHYHINTNDENKLKSTTTTSPPTIYGKPIETVAPPPPPPRNFYRAPIRNRKPNSGYGIPPPPPSRNTYLPPKNSGGYSTPESQKGGYSNSGQTHQEQTSGGYSSSSSSSNFNNQKDSFHHDDQQIVPIITGSGNSGRRGNSKKNNQNNLGLLNLDYTNDDDERDNLDNDYQDDEKFRSRTLFTINKFQERDPPSNPSSSNSFPPTPSNSYGPPPPVSSSQSSNSYGPPAPPQYGPPASSPAPPLNNDNPSAQTQSAQTSITLETIPITTTETRFVTVPKITQTLGGTLQQNLQSPPSNDAPSGGYSGSGGGGSSSSSSSFLEPPSGSNRNNNNNNNNNNNFLSGLNQNPRNILNEQLLQLNPSRGGLPDFSDIETLAFLQAQNNNNNNNNNARNTNPHLLSELLLSQFTNGNNNNFRGSGGSNLFGNPHQSSADLRTLSLLSNPVATIGSGGLRSHQYGHQPQPFSISPNNNVPILHTTNGAGSGFVNGQLQSLRGGSTVLTGDAVGAISDLIREQRLQLAVSDLRNRLRNQHRDADRTRSNYRNLFYKGALLLAGLSLIPTVSTVVSPGLAAAAMVGVGSSTASSSAFTLSSSLLPLTTGRRRRDVHDHHQHHDDDDDDIQIVGSTVNPFSVMSITDKLFDEDDDNNHGQFTSTVVTFPNMNNTYRTRTRESNDKMTNKIKLTNNTNNINLLQTKRTLREKYRKNNLEKVQSNHNMVKETTKQSLFDNMAFKGAFIPQQVREDLEKYLPLDEIMKNSQCLQKYFCETLLQIETFPDPTPILLLYAGLSSDVDKNPWLREAMTAAKNHNCAAFYCYRNLNKQH